jgi:hypothetical protein
MTGGQRLLGHAARLQERGKVGALPELRDAQLDGAGPRLPVAVAIAVALGRPQRVLLAIAGAGRGADLQIHQPLGGKADHLAQDIGVRVFSTSVCRFIMSSVIGGPSNQVGVSNPTLPKNINDRRSLATALPRERLCHRRATPPGGTRPNRPSLDMPYQREATIIDHGALALVRRSEKCPYAIRAVEFLRERLRSGGQYQQPAFGEMLASKKKAPDWVRDSDRGIVL